MAQNIDYDTLRPNRSLGAYYKKKGQLTYKEHILRSLRTIKQRSKRKGIEFKITEADLVFNATCPVLGIPMCFGSERGRTPTIDKIVPEKGYVPGNVRIISHRANRWKNDMSLEDAKLLISNWYEISA